MKIDYTEKEARQIERYYYDMVLAMEQVGRRKCSAREKDAAKSAMFHTLAICGVRFVSDGKFGGAFETWATSPQKAIANIRYRLFGRGCGGRWCDTGSWEAVAA